MILGITGTVGAGKGTVVEYLAKHHGFAHYSVREFLYEEIRRRGKDAEDRTALRETGNALRQEHGPAYVAETLLQRAQEAGGSAVIESIRTVGEAELLKKHGAFIVAIDADKALRYQRAVERGSQTDKLSYEEFCEEENREMAGTAVWDMNVFGVMNIADWTLQNNGDLGTLHADIETMLASFNKRA